MSSLFILQEFTRNKPIGIAVSSRFVF